MGPRFKEYWVQAAQVSAIYRPTFQEIATINFDLDLQCTGIVRFIFRFFCFLVFLFFFRKVLDLESRNLTSKFFK